MVLLKQLFDAFCPLIISMILALAYQMLPVWGTFSGFDLQAGQAIEAQLGPNTLSCAQPTTIDMVRTCREFEQRILAATVRLEWREWDKDEAGHYRYVGGNIGFGTIKAGRYVITHNHIRLPLTGQSSTSEIKISVVTADGTYIWQNVPISAVAIAMQQAQTLTLDFGPEAETKLFGPHGLISAEFADWQSLPLRPGLEVAQVDWNGRVVQIDWVPIDTVAVVEGLPRLELANFVAKGASGGGVFWHGYHIGNNWSRVTTYQKRDAQIVRRYSIVALNPAQVTASPK